MTLARSILGGKNEEDVEMTYFECDFSWCFIEEGKSESTNQKRFFKPIKKHKQKKKKEKKKKR